MNTNTEQNTSKRSLLMPAIIIGVAVIAGSYLISKSIHNAPIALYDHKMKDCVRWIGGTLYPLKKSDSNIAVIMKENSVKRISCLSVVNKSR